MKFVVKLGGAGLENPALLDSCTRAIADLVRDGNQVAVVHGGGVQLTRTLKALGKQSEFIGGLRNFFQLNAAGGVHQHQNDIAGFDRLVHLLQHAPVELRTGLVHAGRIDEDDLRGGMHTFARGDFDHAGNAVARGLRLGRNNGDLFAGEGVEQGAFAGVRSAENCDKSGFQRRECS